MKSTNTIYHNASVTHRRHNQSNKHKSVVIWFTSLSGSCKSTLAHAVEEILDGESVSRIVSFLQTKAIIR